ncbi:hypothetical protein ACFOUV_11550 [Oceanobacillus longus]|uniref:DUF4352 domain-containing protein n=1 Tax=Oceanobacillus longus TaxID=930120 RepID=A0ABV8H0P8_9BACI
MNRWLITTAFMSLIALSACGTSQLEYKSGSGSEVTEKQVIDRKVKEEITLESAEKDEALEETKSSDKESVVPEGKSEEREQNPINDPKEEPENTEEVPDQKDPVEEIERENKPEENNSPEVDPAPETSLEEKKNETPTDFDQYPKGQFAVDGSPGQTVNNSTGEFTIERSAAVSPVNIGPMNIHVENIKLVSGEVTEKSIAGISGKHVRFLQIDAILQNTSDDPIQFFFATTTLDLNGQQLTAHSMFSGITDGNYGTQTPRNATLVYMLNEDHKTSDELKNLTINITANPIDKNTGLEVGSGTTVDVSF